MRFSTNTFVDIPLSLRGEPHASRVASIGEALRTGGVAGGLEALNLGVAHRYSGIFKLQGDLLENTHMFDKRGEPRPDGLARVQLGDSFCQIVLRDGFMATENSGLDPRLDTNPYQSVVVAYHGVPILDASGELSGTLCHFDMVEQSISDVEFACLQHAATLFAPLLSHC